MVMANSSAMAPYLDLIVWTRGVMGTSIFKNDKKIYRSTPKYDSREAEVTTLLSLVVLSH
jgi:hypothetical protein